MAAAGGAHWSSRFAFLMASVGFAVGLGNIWRFPYVAGENGGAAFVLIYLACAFGIGVPILIAELLIGRRGEGSPPVAMAHVAEANKSSRQWQWVGGMGLLAAFTIEIVYAGIVGWVLWYLYKALFTGFAGVDAGGAEAEFAAVLADTPGMLFWTLVGLAITGLIIYSGVKDGIERAVSFMMPLMFLLLLGLAGYNVFAGGFSEAVEWLFTPDFSKIGAGNRAGRHRPGLLLDRRRHGRHDGPMGPIYRARSPLPTRWLSSSLPIPAWPCWLGWLSFPRCSISASIRPPARA